jgi:hypothetical protein
MGKQAFKLVLRPLSALSLVVPMFGVLGAPPARNGLRAGPRKGLRA